MVPPFPPRALGPTGPLPATDLPVRDLPQGTHSCEGCPGGSLVDTSKLVERDHIARCFFDCCRRCKEPLSLESSRLVGQDEWAFFVEQLRDRGLIEEKDVRLFQDPPAAVETGLDISGLQRWLFDKLFADDMRRFEQASESMRAALHSVNISVSYRGLSSLSQKELYTYQVLLSEYEHSIGENLRETLKRIKRTETEWEQRELEGMLQEGHGETVKASTTLVASAYTEGPDPGPLPTTPEEFQWAKGPDIEQALQQVRVISAAFPPREHVLEHHGWGMRRLLGTAAHTEKLPNKYVGAQIEVVEMPWDVPEEYVANAADESNRMEALKHLALSKYFRDYLGFDFSSYSGVGLHFLQHDRGFNLREMVAASGPLAESHALFSHWAREILTGMRDYLYQCCQELTEDLTLAHVFVGREGLQIYFRDVPFGDRRGVLYEEVPECGPRNKWRNGFVAVENRLITMFGNMLLEMLYGRQYDDSPVRTLQELSASLRSVISLAVNARDTLDYFMLAPGGTPSAGAGPAESHALAGGFVSAGIDEFDDGEDYRLWWLKEPPKPLLILPNTERTADDADGGSALEQDWRQAEDERLHLNKRMEWKPNAHLFTIQALLNHTALQRSDNVASIMEAFDAYSRCYLATREQQGRMERFFDGVNR